MAGWDDAATVRYYLAFDQEHARYRRANAVLARQVAITPGVRVLDLAAGTGGTTAALLPGLAAGTTTTLTPSLVPPGERAAPVAGPGVLGTGGRVDCVEPAAAMRAAGMARFAGDARVRWLGNLAEAETAYDRIVCGAAIWQMPDLPALLRELCMRLAPGGRLAFNIPAAYLGRPDRPGGGRDPALTELLGRFVGAQTPSALDAMVPSATPVATPMHGLDADAITACLAACGCQVRRWRHTQRLSQACWRDWLKIPLLTEGLFAGLDPEERARRIDRAYLGVDAASWRHETWFGWTASRPTFATTPLPDDTPLLCDPTALRRHAQNNGCLLLRRLLPPAALSDLRQAVLSAGRALQVIDSRGGWCGATDPTRGPAGCPMLQARLQQRLAQRPEWQALERHPALLQVMRLLFDAEPTAGLGSVCRVAPPDHQVPATPPHRDSDYIAEPAGLWTAWLPLADCSIAQGVLAVAPGSRRQGNASPDWAAAPMKPGDVLLFSAQTLHRACANLHPTRPRLSADFRFAPCADAAQAVTSAGLRP